MPQIFDTYVKQIKLLNAEKLLDVNDENRYVCPLCLHRFTSTELNKLSLEDAPQQSLGGRKIALTCKKCNNTCGSTIDNHLVKLIEWYDEYDFIEGSDRDIEIIKGNKKLNATLKVDCNKELTMYLQTKRNNPILLQEHVESTKEGDIIDIKNRNLNIDFKKASTAILKNAYIILFAIFGYTFLLDSHYDIIREQIKEPMKYLAPDLWTHQHMNVEDGVYLSNDNQYRGFFIIYSCHYKANRTHRFCCFIPSPLMPYEAAHRYFMEYKPYTPIHMMKVDGDFFSDLQQIKRIREWAYGWKLAF